jgi:hypothetical protein
MPQGAWAGANRPFFLFREWGVGSGEWGLANSNPFHFTLLINYRLYKKKSNRVNAEMYAK